MNESNKPFYIDLKEKTDSRGSLVFAEGGSDIPFEIKRIFYIFGAEENTVRGGHAHFDNNIVLICVAGQCTVKLTEAKGGTAEYLLDSPSRGLYVPACCWREMYDFSEDCVLLALSSAYYSEKDYIRDFSDFMNVYKNISGDLL